MRKDAIAAGALTIGFLAGLTAGLVVERGGDGAHPTQDESSASARPSEPAPSAEPARAAPSAEPARAPVSTVRSSPRSMAGPEPGHGSAAPAGSADLREVLLALPLPDDAGTGTIRGRVRTRSGRPLADVRVKAMGRLEARPSANEDQVDIEGVVRQAVERFHLAHTLARVATTDSEGRFVLSCLGERRYRVTATLEGYEIAGEDTWRVAPGSEVELTASAQVPVQIEVLGVDGRPLPDAWVALQGGESRGEQRWAPGRLLRVAPGTYLVSARSVDGSLRGRASAPLVARAGVAPAPVTVRLETVPGLVVEVGFPAGEDYSRLNVAAVLLPPSSPADPALLHASTHQGSVTPDRPWHRFEQLPPGRYLVGVSGGTEYTVTRTVEVAATGATEVRLDLPPLSRERVVVVQVLGPDGRPLESAQVSGGCQGGGVGMGMTSARGGQTVRKADGSVWFLPIEPKGFFAVLRGEGQGTCYIEASAPGYGSRRVELARGQTEVVISLSEAALLDVVLAGYAGSPLVGAVSVTLEPIRPASPAAVHGRHELQRTRELDRGARWQPARAGLQGGRAHGPRSRGRERGAQHALSDSRRERIRAPASGSGRREANLKGRREPSTEHRLAEASKA